MAISRLDMERQLRKDGGILTIEDAQRMAPPGESLAYINADEAALLKSLGGAGEDINGTGIKSYFIKRLVRKAKKAVKKVVKSPIGKAAILGGLTFGIPGTQFGGFAGGKGLGSFFGKGSFNPFKALITKGPQTGMFGPSGLANLFGKAGLAKGTSLTGLGKIAGITGLSGLAGLMAAGEQDEEDETDLSKLDRGEGLNIADIVRRARLQDSEFRFLPGAEFTDAYAAEGGRIGKQEGGEVDKKIATIKDMLIRGADDDLIKTMTGASQEEINSVKNNQRQDKAEGGGVGSLAMNKENVQQMYVSDEAGALPKKMKDGEAGVLPSDMGKLKKSDFETEEDYKRYLRQLNRKAEGGLMNLGGLEMDLRGGGFVPMGAKEKADDVPARLSKNEFVMTADAVRAAGGGSVDKGADKMYNMMKNLEAQV